MNWAIWLILLIPVGVSILSLLFRAAKEDPRRAAPFRPNRPLPGAPRAARRSVSDIDQFLEEINRRRREASERRNASDPRSGSPPPPPAMRPVPPPPRIKPVKRQEREARIARQRQNLSEPAPVAAQAAQVVPLAELAALQPLPELLETRSAPTVTSTARIMVYSPVVAQALPLLRSTLGLKTAIVLQEIFAKPLSCRDRQGPFPRLPTFGQQR